MIEIRNLTFQPLTLQLAGTPGGLHLGPRGRKPITDAQVSAEIRTAAKRGFVSIAPMVLASQPDNKSAVADVTTADEGAQPADDSSSDAQSKKRR